MIYCILEGLLVLAIAYQLYNHVYLWFTCKPNFTGKTVLITGGSSGIGETLAKEFIKLDAKRVIIAARTLKELERVKSECLRPERISILLLDLSKPEEVLKKA